MQVIWKFPCTEHPRANELTRGTKTKIATKNSRLISLFSPPPLICYSSYLNLLPVSTWLHAVTKSLNPSEVTGNNREGASQTQKGDLVCFSTSKISNTAFRKLCSWVTMLIHHKYWKCDYDKEIRAPIVIHGWVQNRHQDNMQVNTFLITIMQFKKRGIKDYDWNYYLLIQIFSSMMDDTLISFYFMYLHLWPKCRSYVLYLFIIIEFLVEKWRKQRGTSA